MKLTLVTHTPNPDLVVAQAARVCYYPNKANECFTKAYSIVNTKSDASLINSLKESGHMSPFEHVSFTFAADGLSRVTSHQLVRHRMASYSQKSQRYTNSANTRLIVPPTVIANEKARKIFDRLEDETLKAYNDLLYLGIPKEDARFILPHGMETSIVFTMNARALINFFTLRLCNRSQKEIQVLAMKMLVKVSEVAPIIFSGIGPNCVMLGICKEKDYCDKGPFKDYVSLLTEALSAEY